MIIPEVASKPPVIVLATILSPEMTPAAILSAVTAQKQSH